MAIVMGVRTVIPRDLQPEVDVPRADLLAACQALDPASVTEAEVAAGGVTPARHLAILDRLSSTATLGFRIDAAQTVVGHEIGALPLPAGLSLSTLRTEEHVRTALASFL